MAAAATRPISTHAKTWICPFKEADRPVCLAATPCEGDLGFLTSSRCETETHDTCPLYLVKVLHGLRPLAGRRADELRTK